MNFVAGGGLNGLYPSKIKKSHKSNIAELLLKSVVAKASASQVSPWISFRTDFYCQSFALKCHLALISKISATNLVLSGSCSKC